MINTHANLQQGYADMRPDLPSTPDPNAGFWRRELTRIPLYSDGSGPNLPCPSPSFKSPGPTTGRAPHLKDLTYFEDLRRSIDETYMRDVFALQQSKQALHDSQKRDGGLQPPLREASRGFGTLRQAPQIDSLEALYVDFKRDSRDGPYAKSKSYEPMGPSGRLETQGSVEYDHCSLIAAPSDDFLLAAGPRDARKRMFHQQGPDVEAYTLEDDVALKRPRQSH